MDRSFKVAGVTFKNDETGVSRQSLLGTIYDDFWTEDREDEITVVLRAEPENRYDPDAVGVWCEAPIAAAGRLGFVPGDRAREIGRMLREGRVKRVAVVDMGAVRHKVWLEIEVETGEPVRTGTIVDEEGCAFEF